MALSKQSSYKFLRKGRHPKVDETVLFFVTKLYAKGITVTSSYATKAGGISKSLRMDEKLMNEEELLWPVYRKDSD